VLDRAGHELGHQQRQRNCEIEADLQGRSADRQTDPVARGALEEVLGQVLEERGDVEGLESPPSPSAGGARGPSRRPARAGPPAPRWRPGRRGGATCIRSRLSTICRLFFTR
jgi:hypothetical protein